jgi:hemolysin D
MTPFTVPAPKKSSPFDQAIVLQQPKGWSRWILWTILGLAAFTVTWASVTEIEEAIPATGKLEPEGAVKDVQTPISGVVTEILVKDGQKVKKGDLLLKFDTTTATAQVTSQEKIRAALVEEVTFYQAQLAGEGIAGSGLTKSREAIDADTQLLRAQVEGDRGNLSTEQQRHLATKQATLNAHVDRAKLDAAQTQRQLQEVDVQMRSAQDNLAMNQNILSRLQPLQKAGGISVLQVLKQEQEVMKYQAQIDQMSEQRSRMALDADKATEDIHLAQAETTDSALTKISINNKQIAEMDTQASRTILENQKKIAELDAQLSQAKMTLQYQELRAPADGTVFELKAGTPGYVASPSVPVLKIVPTNNLIAKIDIQNKDIGFVREGMAADVRLDSFPFREFGGMRGELVNIGSDALLPDQLHQYYRFPAKIKIDGQVIQINGREVALQSGMSVNVNLKLRKRRVINIFLDEVLKTTDSLKILR